MYTAIIYLYLCFGLLPIFRACKNRQKLSRFPPARNNIIYTERLSKNTSVAVGSFFIYIYTYTYFFRILFYTLAYFLLICLTLCSRETSTETDYDHFARIGSPGQTIPGRSSWIPSSGTIGLSTAQSVRKFRRANKRPNNLSGL